ncbi:MAG: histidine kinase, partial [Mycobacteriaceae bacterium]
MDIPIAVTEPAAGSLMWRRTWRADLTVPVLLGAVEIVGTHFAALRQTPHRPLDVLAYLLVVAGAVALIGRRRHPAPVLAAVFATTLAYSLLGYPNGPVFLSLIAAFFTTAVQGDRRIAWATLAAGLVCFSLLGYLIDRPPAADGFPGGVAGLAAWLLVLAAAAELTRIRRQRLAQTTRAATEQARRHAGEERLRIARELHDVLGHHLSLISIQAGVGLDLMQTQPEQAHIALSTIKQASTDALGELRWVLDVLRDAREDPPRSPPPSLDRIHELLAQSTAAGLDVDVTVEGRPRQLPTALDLAAYRIVQEA